MITNQQFFVGIGAAKAGTTWLANYFRKHPDVCLSPIKELHYFDFVYIPEQVEGISRMFAQQLHGLADQVNAGLEIGVIRRIGFLARRLEMNIRPEAYREYFDPLVKDKHRVFGEITPSYSMIGEAGYSGITQMFPGAKFVLILRNPVDRYWSQLRFSQKILADFSASSEFENRLFDTHFTGRGNYQHTLESLEAVVPREDVFITFYEDLFGDSGRSELSKLNEFLGTRDVPGDFGSVANKSPDENLTTELREKAVAQFREIYRAVEERMVLPQSWQDDLGLLCCETAD